MIFLRLYGPLTIYVVLLTLGLIRWKRIDPSQKLVTTYEGICVVITLGLELFKVLRLDTSVLVYIFSPIQTLLFAEILAQGVGSLKVRKWLRSLAIAYALFWLGWVVMRGTEAFHSYNNPVFHIHTAVDLLLALVCLAERSLDYKITLTSQAVFWVAAGFLMDSALCLIFYPARDWLKFHRPDVLNIFIGSRAILVMITHLLYGKALLCPPRTRSS